MLAAGPPVTAMPPRSATNVTCPLVAKLTCDSDTVSVPPEVLVRFSELNDISGVVGDPSNGYETPVVTLTTKTPSGPENVTAPRSGLRSPAPLSEIVTLLPSVERLSVKTALASPASAKARMAAGSKATAERRRVFTGYSSFGREQSNAYAKASSRCWQRHCSDAAAATVKRSDSARVSRALHSKRHATNA